MISTMRRMKWLTLLLVISLSASGAFAQGKGRDGRAQPQQMSQKDRQQMRDDMREAYRDHDRGRGQQDRQRPMSREERDKLRQDIQEANKQIRR